MVAASTRAGNDYDKSLFTALRQTGDPTNQSTWAGSVIVSTANGTDVAVVAYNQRPTDRISVGFSGVVLSTPDKLSFCVFSAKASNWRWRPSRRLTILFNATTNNATDVDITDHNPNGTVAAQELQRKALMRARRLLATPVWTAPPWPAWNNWKAACWVQSAAGGRF